MFKYLWLIILIILWLLWLYSTVRDCIEVFKEHISDDALDFCDNLKWTSFTFIFMTVLFIIGFSFYEWLISYIFIE